MSEETRDLSKEFRIIFSFLFHIKLSVRESKSEVGDRLDRNIM